LSLTPYFQGYHDMPVLKDYLGSLVKDLNHARVIADIESANIAEMYAEHHLLKNFSIPRMKIMETELTIPVSIDDLDTVAQRDYQPIDNKKFYAKAYVEIKNSLKVSRFSRQTSKVLKTSIYAEIKILESEIKSSDNIKQSLNNFSARLSKASIKSVIKEPKLTNIDTARAEKELTADLTKYLAPQIKPRDISGNIENAKVTVESDKLKDKKPESLLYIKMKIKEESMEWHTMEDAEGNIISKLMVE